MSIIDKLQSVIWTAPDGTAFTIKTLECGYTQKHIGEVKENPRTTISTSKSTKAGGGKKSKTSSSASVSTSASVKKVQDSNDTFTDLGVGGRDISLDCYFIGENHLAEAKAFRDALCQIGKSQLQLAYGEEFTVNVLTFDVKKSLVDRVNSMVITVQWHETSKTTYPKSNTSKTKEIKNSVASVKEAIAENVANAVNKITTPTRLNTFVGNFTKALNKISSALDVANNVSLNSIMGDILGQNITSNAFTITSQIGVLFAKSAGLVNKVSSLDSGFKLPSGFSSLFGGWNSLISSLKSSTITSTTSSTFTKEQIDELILNDSIASSAIVSASESFLTMDFTTRAEAVMVAKNLIALNDSWSEFVDEQASRITELENAYIRDSGVDDVVVATANEILERSYKLRIEQTITLAQDKTPMELAWEYYKEDFLEDPDKTLNYLITSNGWGDNEFLLIKRGTEVKIYV